METKNYKAYGNIFSKMVIVNLFCKEKSISKMPNTIATNQLLFGNGKKCH
jgi:hypothetical protein